MGEGLLSDAAVKAIQESVATEVISVGKEIFTTRPVFEPPRDAVPAALKLNTLTGLASYVNEGPDNVVESESGLSVHVVNERQVDVVSGLFGRFELRKTFAIATADAVLSKASFSYGEYYNCEDFVIKLQSLFEPTASRADVLRVVGNIKEENVRQTADDGVTQTVTARSGVARVEDVQVPNPVTLAPYRTFREVTQPASPFILRLKQGHAGAMPSVALFEADGGQWKLEAIARVQKFLQEKITAVNVIA